MPRRASALLLAASLLATAHAVSPSPSASQPWVPGNAPVYPEPSTGSAPPLPERALSLGDLIDLALRDNPDTESSWQVAVQAAATQNRALGAFLPDLSANVGFGKQYQKTDGQLTAGPIFVPELQIVNTPSIAVTPAASLTWMLWDFGASKAGFDAARAGLVAANYQHNRTLQGVVRQVQMAYFNFDAARGALAAADASADLASSTLNATMMKRGNGLIGLSAEMQSRQGEVQARMQREQVRLSYEQARAQLYELAGLTPDAKVTIAEQAPGTEPAPVVAAVGALVDQTLATRPDLAARYAKLAALEFALQRAQRAYLPTVVFSSSASRLKGGQSTLTSTGVDNPTAIQQAQVSRYNTSGYIETASAGISVNADITSLFTYSQVVKEKRAEIDAAKAELHSALITAQHDVWLAVDACQSARDQYTEAKELLDISQRGFHASQQARESGLQSNLDLLTSQQELAQARYSLVGARARLFTSAADLAFATGQTAMGAEPGGG